MTKRYFVLLTIFLVAAANAQNINFPNQRMKERLLRSSDSTAIAKDLSGNYFKIDANDDGEIQVDEALQVSYLNLYSTHHEFMDSIEGIRNFANLIELDCHRNILTQLDLSGLENLRTLDCSWNNNGLPNGIVSLNLSGCTSLEYIDCKYNHLTGLDVSDCMALKTLICYSNSIASLDVSMCNQLETLYCHYNDLTFLNIQNNSNETTLNFHGNTGLEHVCTDTFQMAAIEAMNNQFDMSYTVSDDCLALASAGFENQTEVTISPNPASAMLNIDSKQPISEINIYNTLGQLVLIGKEKSAIDVSPLKAGNYLIKIISGQKTISKKFIKI